MSPSPTQMARRPRRGGRMAEYLPFGWLLIALAMVLALLPTALRPPPDTPSTTAELSPDAPPDDSQESIVAALQRARSATAGAGAGDGPGTETAADLATLSPPTPREPPPRFCPGGFGDPPRQVESVYAAPCAPAWDGDNGGATWKGVTATEVRVAVRLPGSDNAEEEGPIPTELQGDESGELRNLIVMQKYFNQNYQFWGRFMRFVQIRHGDDNDNNDPAESRAAAIRSDEQYKVFLGIHEFAAYGEEMARRQLGSWILSFPEEDFFAHAPYIWSIYPDIDKEARMGAELLCKKLVGKPAAFAGPTLQSVTRRVGVVANYEENRRYRSEDFRAAFRDACNGEVVEAVDFNGFSDRNETATAIARLQSSNVTSIVLATDLVPAIQLMNQATSQGYFPEWMFFHGYGSMTHNLLGKLMPQEQMEHAFGFHPMEMPRTARETECYRAYKSVAPEHEPARFICKDGWFHFLQIANGIQMAGPNLTPTTFAQGLRQMGLTDPEQVWAMDGSYGPRDFTFVDTFPEIWWDRYASDPENGSLGAWRFVRGGRRYAEGEQLVEDPLFFQDGVTRPPRE